MTTIILGHGGTDPLGSEHFVVPPGTKITMYGDFGQDLDIPAIEENGTLLFDYSDYASAWEHYKSAGYVEGRAPGDCDLTYDYTLGPIEEKEVEMAAKLDWGGAQVVAIGHGLPAGARFCTGDATTCPTDATLLAWNEHEKDPENNPEVPADAWKHKCGGILGSLGDSLDRADIRWVACSGIHTKMLDRSALPPDSDLSNFKP